MPAGHQYNILFIMDDQHRADCLGVDGHPAIRTPHLDQISYEGVRFRSAYVDCPVCIPSRCSLISGQYATTYNRPYFFSHQHWPVDRTRTMMGLLGAAGYQTQAVGKMHFWPERACYGFDNMVLDLDYADWLGTQGDYGGAFLGRGMGLNEFEPVRSAVPANMSPTAWTVNESIRFLSRRDPDRPFFLWTSFNKPHPPMDPPEPYDTMYQDVEPPPAARGDWERDGPPGYRLHMEANKYDRIDAAGVRRIRRAYYGLITEIDHQLGRLLGYMKRNGLYDNTLIVFTSDHGEQLGDHGDFGKELLYESSARVPLIMRLPADYPGARHGAVVDQPVALVDLLPTLTAVAGTHAPSGIDGRSLLPLALGEPAPWRDYVPLHMDRFGGLYALSDGREKYLWFRWGGREQLFDLTTDRAECNDLSEEQPERLAEWRRRLVTLLECRRDAPVRDGVLEPDLNPYPDDCEVRARNPLAWNYNRPFS